ncbi:MAG: ABC transporter ATP-binding protein [bacterium]|nr:ABC transporter ATP-binding protein [bacterium]
MSLVIARDIHKSYYLGNSEVQVLKGIDLEIQSGETIAVIGPSGVGKSTMLNLLGALDRPTRGEIEIAGVRIWDLSNNELANLRAAQIGFVFQFHHLLPEFSAIENVLLPGLIRGNNYSDSKARAAELLSRVGLGERLNHRPGELSGGEQQRVALARALQNDPPLVLADEPTGNLDRDTALELQTLIFEMAQERQRSFMIVTHDRHFAARCGQVLQMQDGRLSPVATEDF